jgi:hypothetical protein
VIRPEIRPAGAAAKILTVARAIRHAIFKAANHGESWVPRL